MVAIRLIAATAVGLALIGFGRGLPAWGAAAVLILAPHVIGAPHPDSFAGPVTKWIRVRRDIFF